MAAATPQGRWVFLVVLCCLPNLASAATGWAGQRLTGAPYYWGWPVEDKSFLTYEEAVAWTLANSPDPLMMYKEMTINGKRHVLFSQPSQYTPSVLDPNAGEPRYCDNWTTGMPASGIAPSGHVMYGPDGTFPAHIVVFNNCIQPGNIFWRIVSAPVMDVHEVEVQLPECPVGRLTNIPNPDRDSGGSLTLATQAAEQCLREKIEALGITYGGPTSAVRSPAYQSHLKEVWDKMESLVALMENNPAMQQICASRRSEVAAEKGCNHAGGCRPAQGDCSGAGRNHCLIYPPIGDKHSAGTAFDISENTVNQVIDNLQGRNPPLSLEELINGTTIPPNSSACNLRWGGTFSAPPGPDPIHFQLR